MTEYILTDRTTSTKWSITIVDGEVTRTSTASAASAEPIFEDDATPGDYWKLFMDDDEMSWESTVTVQDDIIELTDTVTANVYRLVIEDGEFGITEIAVVGTGVNADQAPEANYKVELRNKNFDLVKILNKIMTSCSWEWNETGGCGSAQVMLSIDPDDIKDLITPEAEIRIFLREKETDSFTLFYRGYLESYKPSDLVPNSRVQLIANGYSTKLKRARVDRTYTNTEVSAIVEDILTQDVLPITAITFDSADIELTDFVIDSITFDTDAASAIRTLSLMTGSKNYEWGVDRDLKVFFKKPLETIVHTVRYRRGVISYNEIEDYGGIVNRLVIKGAGSFEDTVNNTESQSSFGLRSQTFVNSAISTTAVSQQYGSGILSEKARIQRRVSVKRVKIIKLYEDTTPVGRMAVVKEPVATARKVNKIVIAR